MTRRWLSRIDAAWYAPAPPTRLALLRVAVGSFALVYLLIRARSLTSVVRFERAQFAPVGPIAWLEAPLAPALVYLATALCALFGLGFLLGFRYRLCAPAFALLLLWVTSYRSSFGMTFHTENLLCLHVWLLALAPAGDVWSLDARRRGQGEALEAHGRYGWAMRAMCAVTAATYLLAGVAKLKIAGLAWADGDVLRLHVAYDNLRKIELGSIPSPFARWLVQQGWLFSPLAWLTLLLELGAPAALFSARVARLWCLGAWLFHWGVLAFMAIAFPYPLSFIAYLPFFRVEQLARGPLFRGWLSSSD